MTDLNAAVTTSLGQVRTVEEAGNAFAETIARARIREDLELPVRDADTDDKIDLGDALQDTLGLDLAGLYAFYGDLIEVTYARFCTQVAAP